MIPDAMREPCPWCGGTGTVVKDEAAGKALAAARKAAGIQQIEMAKRLGISKGYLCDLESGNRRWAPDLLARYETELRRIGLALVERCGGAPAGVGEGGQG